MGVNRIMGTETKIEPCDICGTKYTKEMFKIRKKMMADNIPCFCSDIKRIVKLKKEIKSQKEEIGYLNEMLSDADSSGWDADGMYEDAMGGTFNRNNIGGVPNKKYAKWIAKRYGLVIDKDGELI